MIHSSVLMPGLIHDQSCVDGGVASLYTRSFVNRSASLAVRATTRQGNVRVPFVLAIKFLRETTTHCLAAGRGARTSVEMYEVLLDEEPSG